MYIMQKGLIVHTIISNDQGEILLLQRSKKNDVLPEYWDVPGGTLEDGEDPAVGAIREIKEEAGLDISNVKLFFQKSNIDTSKNKQFVTLIFHAKTSNTNAVINPEEHDALTWIKPADVGTYKVVNYLPDCLRAYKDLSTNPIN
jgi:8-oxo-dGTP diphosphatase